MFKANFIRKACLIEELKAASLKPSIDKYIIEEIIELDQDEYDYFINNLLEDFDFISEHKDKMYIDVNKVWHCILVKALGANDGILVESEGYDYARYTAYLN